LAPIRAAFRNAHDNLWERQKFFFQAKCYRKQIDYLLEIAQKRAAIAGSELSIDPDGRNVLDAFTTFLQTQANYFQIMAESMGLQTLFLGKADMHVLDEFASKMDEELTALEEAIRLYVDSPSDVGQPVAGAEQVDLIKAKRTIPEESAHGRRV